MAMSLIYIIPIDQTKTLLFLYFDVTYRAYLVMTNIIDIAFILGNTKIACLYPCQCKPTLYVKP